MVAGDQGHIMSLHKSLQSLQSQLSVKSLQSLSPSQKSKASNSKLHKFADQHLTANFRKSVKQKPKVPKLLNLMSNISHLQARSNSRASAASSNRRSSPMLSNIISQSRQYRRQSRRANQRKALHSHSPYLTYKYKNKACDCHHTAKAQDHKEKAADRLLQKYIKQNNSLRKKNVEQAKAIKQLEKDNAQNLQLQEVLEKLVHKLKRNFDQV